MSVATQIQKKILIGLNSFYVEVLNESANHATPPDAETHFKVTVVSEKFIDQPPVKRHQMVYDILDEEVHSKIHALAIHTYTKEEWDLLGHQVPESAPCVKKEH